jgi:hypothetical protein
MLAAAESMAGVSVIDLNDYFCQDGKCPFVIGNVLVYRDNHMTDSYSLTLVKPIRGHLLGY